MDVTTAVISFANLVKGDVFLWVDGDQNPMLYVTTKVTGRYVEYVLIGDSVHCTKGRECNDPVIKVDGKQGRHLITVLNEVDVSRVNAIHLPLA